VAKSIPDYRRYTKTAQRIFALENCTEVYLFQNDEYQLSACRDQPVVLPKKNPVSPRFAVFQHKLSTDDVTKHKRLQRANALLRRLKIRDKKYVLH